MPFTPSGLLRSPHLTPVASPVAVARHSIHLSIPTTMSTTASFSANHPQLEIHALSLLSESKKKPAVIHDPAGPLGPGIESVGNADALAFWLNAAKSIDWIKPPTVAHGLVKGDIVRPGYCGDVGTRLTALHPP